MRKDLPVSEMTVRMIIDERMRFVILDNTHLHVNRGDTLCFIPPKGKSPSTTVDGSGGYDKHGLFGRVTFVTNHGVVPGWVAAGFELVAPDALMGESMMNGLTIAEGVSARGGIKEINRQRFSSDEHFEEYKRLSRLIAENSSKKATLQMKKRRAEFEAQRSKIPMREVTDATI